MVRDIPLGNMSKYVDHEATFRQVDKMTVGDGWQRLLTVFKACLGQDFLGMTMNIQGLWGKPQCIIINMSGVFLYTVKS
jgi:hypothetical protein